MTDGGTDRFEYSRTIENGFQRCVWCGIVFGAEDRDDHIRGVMGVPGIGGGVNYTHGPVRDRSGTEYECVGDSPPGAYLMHGDCYLEYHAEVASEVNESLHEYAPDGGHPPAAGGPATPPERVRRDGRAFLSAEGPHLCDLCRRTFRDLAELAEHNCRAPGGVLLDEEVV